MNGNAPSPKRAKAPWATPTSSSVDSISALSEGVPKISVSQRDLRNLTPKQRLVHIGKRLLSAQISSFARGAVLRTFSNYIFDAFIPETKASTAWRNTIHNCINLNEIQSVVTSLVNIEPEDDDEKVDLSKKHVLKRMLANHVAGYFNVDTNHLVNENFEGYSYNKLYMSDLIKAFSTLNAKTSELCDIKMIYSESYGEDSKNENESHLFIFDTLGHRYALYLCKANVTRNSFQIAEYELTLFQAHSDNTVFDSLSEHLTKIVRTNFVTQLNPEKNILEIEEFRTKTVPRQNSYEYMPNLDIAEITKSIRYALENKKRLVIVIVGDGGLGKTAAIHTILNQFTDIPSFVITPAAVGDSPNAVRSIFDTLTMFECLSVFDDFDGFNVKTKNEVTTEFLRQFSGASGFNGVALVAVNDPSQVNPLLINRPGRMDSIYLMRYLDNIDEVKLVLGQHFDSYVFDGYDTILQKMLDLKFSNSRMIRAVEFAEEQGGLTYDKFAYSVERVNEFEKIATAQVSKGRLSFDTNGDACNDDAVVEPDDAGRPCAYGSGAIAMKFKSRLRCSKDDEFDEPYDGIKDCTD